MIWHVDFKIVFQKDFGGFYFIDLYGFAGQSLVILARFSR